MKLFDLAKSQGRVLYCAAPMVRYSKVSFGSWGFCFIFFGGGGLDLRRGAVWGCF